MKKKPTLKIPQATTKGYVEVEPGMVFDSSFPYSKLRRGRLQFSENGICPTLLNHKGAEPAILTSQRTELAKQLRREGIETFAHRELVPRDDGVSNTLTSVQHDNMLLEPCGMYDNQFGDYSRDPLPGLARTLKADHHNAVLEPKSCAMRGRGENNEQRLEFGDDVANCLTSVQKDSMVATPVDGYEYRLMPNGNIRAYNPASRNYEKGVTGYHITNPENVADTVIATHKPNIIEQKKQGKTMYRIRKLTETECYRLQGVHDSDIEKMRAYPWKSYEEREKALSGLSEKERKRELRKGISKSKHYCLAGNSITVDVLYYIFYKMFINTSSENTHIQLSLFD